MSVKETLEIILITYNRENYLKRTMGEILSEASPIKDFQITILDNNSSDGTEDYIKEVMQSHPNVSYSKNKYNLGISGNIAKAFEFASKKYFWVLADDDKYDWSNWSEVEGAINREEDVICVADYAIKDKSKVAEVIRQLTFLPAGIYKRSNLTDEVMLNCFYNIYTLFPHLTVVFDVLNDGKSIFVCKKAIVDNNMDQLASSSSYTRGYSKDKIYPRINNMLWNVGYLNIIEVIKDKKLKQECIKLSNAQDVSLAKDFKAFFKHKFYSKNAADMFLAVGFWDKILFIFTAIKFYLVRCLFTNPYQFLIRTLRKYNIIPQSKNK